MYHGCFLKTRRRFFVLPLSLALAAGCHIVSSAAHPGASDGDSSPNTVAAISAVNPLPSPWTSIDIGPVGVAGSGQYSNGIFTVNQPRRFFVLRSPCQAPRRLLVRLNRLSSPD